MPGDHDDPPPAAPSRASRDRAAPRAPALLLLAAAAAGGALAGTGGDRAGPGASSAAAPDALAASLAAGRPPTARVVETIDGDTARVRVRVRGRPVETKLRYLGVDTPESVHPSKPVECWGPAASRLNHRWAEGRLVRLRFDREPADHYGRLLVMLVPVDGGPSLNARLVAAGAGRVLTIAPNGRWAPALERAERRARRQRRGLWRDCPRDTR